MSYADQPFCSVTTTQVPAGTAHVCVVSDNIESQPKFRVKTTSLRRCVLMLLLSCQTQIRTADPLPGQEFKLAQYAKQGSYSVRLTGYPALNEDPGCESSAYAGACRQYSSTDTMQVTSSGMYSSSNLDLCRGHSGSGVMTADADRYITAIVTGGPIGQQVTLGGQC